MLVDKLHTLFEAGERCVPPFRLHPIKLEALYHLLEPLILKSVKWRRRRLTMNGNVEENEEKGKTQPMQLRVR